MKGNSFSQFMDDLFLAGGPEKEYCYLGKKYMLETSFEHGLYTMVIFECNNDDPTYIFSHTSSNIIDCVSAFEKAKIFNNKTIYDEEKNIEVLFG